jgi:hypothetical protein
VILQKCLRPSVVLELYVGSINLCCNSKMQCSWWVGMLNKIRSCWGQVLIACSCRLPRILSSSL